MLGVPDPGDLAIDDLEDLDTRNHELAAVSGRAGQLIRPRCQRPLDHEVDRLELEQLEVTKETTNTLSAVGVAHLGDLAAGVMAIHRITEKFLDQVQVPRVVEVMFVAMDDRPRSVGHPAIVQSRHAVQRTRRSPDWKVVERPCHPATGSEAIALGVYVRLREVEGEPERVRVGVSTAVIVVLAVATALAVLSFARAWTYSLDRPWFPLLMLVTLAGGWLWIRRLVRSWQFVEFVDRPRPVLRLIGPFGRRRELPLDDVEDVALIDWAWKRSDAVPMPSGGSVTNQYEGVDRILLIRSKDDAIAIGSAAKRDAERYVQLAERIAASTIERPPTKSGRGRRRHGPIVPIPADAFWVNQSVAGSGQTASQRVGLDLIGGAVIAFVAVWTALALPPGYIDNIQPAVRAQALLRNTRSALRGSVATTPGVEPVMDRVIIEADPCARSDTFIWGETGKVAALEAQLSATVSEPTLARLRATMAERGFDRDQWGVIRVDGGDSLWIDIDGNVVAFRFRTSCLAPEDHPKVEGTLRRTLAPIVYDLTQP